MGDWRMRVLWVILGWSLVSDSHVRIPEEMILIKMTFYPLLSSVPEYLTDEQFWQRYLFHKHMIEDEEQKRKLLLQSE